nr:myotubularin-related protein DDB_G0290005-like [Dermatophagoides farinae]XP_046911102.1 myotubularin-related protein DDB_G0290005-like [Dermatophagoides farinae]
MPNNRYIGHHHHHHYHRHHQNHNQQQRHQIHQRQQNNNIHTTATIADPYGITLIAANPVNHSQENHLDVGFHNNHQQRDQLNNTMSQTAQIVLLPTQNLQVSNGFINEHHTSTLVQKTTVAEPVQMILPTNNDLVGSYQVAAATFPNVSVLVPSTILIANQNECILIPQQQNSQNICQPNLSLQVASSNNHQLFYTSPIDSSYEATNVEYEEVPQQQPQEEQECEIIALDNNISAQTVLTGIAMTDQNETILNHQPTHLINNNCQIIGIVHNGTNQVSILQQQQQPQSSLVHSTSVDQTIQQQVLLSKCVDSNDSNNNKQNQQSMEIHTNGYQYDMNEFLTTIAESSSSALTTTVTKEKSDPDQAKEWLKDCFIVNRALKALKKANNNNSNIQQSNDQNRTVQIIKRNSYQ